VQFLASATDVQTVYGLLNAVVVPRPIAWITSISAHGLVNLAPFSFFTLLAVDPPLLGVSFSQRTSGGRKDTTRNILEQGEFVVHIADETMAGQVATSSGEFAPEVSEVDLLGLATLSSATVAVPRLACAPVAMECRYHRTFDLGEGSEFVIGEVTAIHIRDDLMVDGRVDAAALKPLARIGYSQFARFGGIVPRPAVSTLADVARLRPGADVSLEDPAAR
jgi:flavin reductase (DIM6/NTAB) family NADH-FMN oxidoreductase RutF